MFYLKDTWKKLQNNWRVILISCVAILITFCNDGLFIENSIWIKWIF